MSGRRRGFTLIELLVVMAIIATLLSLVGPRYFASLDRARETVLRTNLRLTREAIDKHHADTGRYPGSLQELVDRRYLRELPLDPVTDRSDTWVFTAPQGGGDAAGPANGIYDLRSGAEGHARDGTPYASW
ncbi:type II secretion system GspH family protein [Aquabacterium sp. A7-Y]|uniref:type II secretion system protein n=1 Tax=Aquabacterium sp. A7-Y TaxID=1349605 RepID=UPI00223DB546|nr:prepilin-type N-terminal cleavage/methylation domain-containing protein [Aquabacterium sp. A7-Y]MCW7541275.1 type II secretion system GspH family protein [Aquabacterium sp. A7-Y]